MVVFCPNAGLLSSIVLSLIPLLLPFHWQSLLLPVLPAGEGRLELVEVGRPVLRPAQAWNAACAVHFVCGVVGGCAGLW